MYIPLTFGGTSERCLYASGGVENIYISGSQQWGYHIFTGSGNFTVTRGTINNAEIWVVGGGGGGASSPGTTNGGGGGGGVAYQSNVRLFGGSYVVTIGTGGNGGFWNGSVSNNGGTGGSSSFNGSNYFLGAGGGGGGQYGTGFSERGGASGDPSRFLGGLNTSNNGGGGGGAGATGNAGNAVTNPSWGGNGLTYYITDLPATFGCGGGGDRLSGTGRGGCESAGDSDEDPNPIWIYGGGGGGGRRAPATRAGNGGNGCVIVKYPIAENCNDYFNETGSCDCRQIKFDVGSGAYPEVRGYYIYTPCGTNEFVSASIYTNFPTTVCAASGSWYWLTSDAFFNPVPLTAATVSTGSECSVGTLCVTQSFVATCSSSLVTFYAGSGSTTYWYVPKTGSQVIYESLAAASTAIRCITTASVAVVEGFAVPYPYAIGGVGSNLYPSACNTITINTNSSRFNYTPCGGTDVRDGTVTIGQQLCVDIVRPIYTTSGFPTVSYTLSGSCLNSVISTGSCGCP